VPISPRQDTAGPMCRTVGGRGDFWAAVDRRGGRWASVHMARRSKRFRLRGVRVGVMPVPQGARIRTPRGLFADARAGARAGRAGGDRGLDVPEGV